MDKVIGINSFMKVGRDDFTDGTRRFQISKLHVSAFSLAEAEVSSHWVMELTGYFRSPSYRRTFFLGL